MREGYSGIFFATCLTLAAHQCFALDFALHPNSKSKTLNAILATGSIENGDLLKLRNLISILPVKKNTAVYLASPGGNLREGLLLGRFFRSHRIKTVVEGGEICASACALAFLGGTDGRGKPWRSNSTTSRLGFHAFRSDGISLNTDETQNVVAEILTYGREVDAPLELLISGFSTSASQMYWVNDQELCSLGIKLWSIDEDRFMCND